MILNLEGIKIPLTIPKEEWDLLFELAKEHTSIGIDVSQSYFNAVPHWTLREELGKYKFVFHRNKVTKQRITESDPLGLVGFSSINPKDDRVYLTEGVSDFLTMKLTHPNMNVLGMTTLSGSIQAKRIVSSLFNRICIVADNDVGGVNTGVSNATNMMKFYSSLGKSCKVALPDTGFKDITEQFIFELTDLYIKENKSKIKSYENKEFM